MLTTTPTPTSEPTSTPIPTSTPTPALPPADEVLAAARDAIDGLEAYRYSFAISGPARSDTEGTGAWVAPGDYQLLVSIALCPPPVPGGETPDQTDCDFVPVYEAIGANGQAYANPFDGEWSEGTQASRFGVDFIDDDPSPARTALEGGGPAELLRLEAEVVDGTPVYRVVFTAEPLPAGADYGTLAFYELLLDRESNWPVDFVISDGSVRKHWAFTGHNDPITIQRPAGF